ncbi:META domain-containing protein [Spirosoma sp.]|uniref:META domain-containing protein n=1 Tax=Spirosoma sp. TaxID=1899569 RepID=UPI003B3B0038
MISGRAIVFLLTLSLILLFAQCGQKESVIAPNIAALLGTWQLVEPDSTYDVTLTFAYDSRNPPQDITPFNVTGKASVNSYSARLFATLDGTLSADNVASTDMAGSPQALQFERVYFDNLGTVARYELPAPNQLRMYHGGKQPGVLVYKRIK